MFWELNPTQNTGKNEDTFPLFFVSCSAFMQHECRRHAKRQNRIAVRASYLPPNVLYEYIESKQIVCYDDIRTADRPQVSLYILSVHLIALCVWLCVDVVTLIASIAECAYNTLYTTVHITRCNPVNHDKIDSPFQHNVLYKMRSVLFIFCMLSVFWNTHLLDIEIMFEWIHRFDITADDKWCGTIPQHTPTYNDIPYAQQWTMQCHDTARHTLHYIHCTTYLVSTLQTLRWCTH